MSNEIVPFDQVQRRPPEAGRIRLGVKTATAMKAIDSFRFTSPHLRAIEQLAELYGGTVQPWSDPRARIQNQYEVRTPAKQIAVFLPPGGLSQWYELWSGGGVSRRCDGIEAQVAGKDDMEVVPCVCRAKGMKECLPYTRLNVVLKGVDFYGTWRLETKGENAKIELPGMYDMITNFALAGRMVDAFLNLEARTQVKNGKKKNFVVPTISVGSTPDELLAGSGTARPQLASATPVAISPAPFTTGEDDAPQMVPDEIIDGEVVTDEDMIAESKLRDLAEAHRLDPQDFVDAVWSDTDGDIKKINAMLKRAADGKVVPVAITPQGSVQWKT